MLPGPQVNVLGQPPLTEVSGFATNPIQASCTQCHTNNGNGALQQGQDVVPPKLIGLGLLGAIEDSQIEQWAAGNDGRVSRVTVNGQQQIGRFGWRAQTVSLRHQIAKALHNDSGVGSPFEGFGPAEVSNAQLDDLVNYSKLIAVPVPRDNLTAMPGHQLFQDFGCNSCHKMTVTTGVDNGFPEVSNQVIHPYTDLLLHDLGEGEYRTAPLWGIGLSGYVRDGNAATFNLMHDGASLTLDAAIQRHNGDATAAKSAYNASAARQQLIDYLMAL